VATAPAKSAPPPARKAPAKAAPKAPPRTPAKKAPAAAKPSGPPAKKEAPPPKRTGDGFTKAPKRDTSAIQPKARTVEDRAAQDAQARFADRTKKLAEDPKAFSGVMKQAYPEKANDAEVERLRTAALDGKIPQPANLHFVDPKLLHGNAGAYSAHGNGTVYLDRGLIGDPARLDRVYAEEVGHHLDRQFRSKKDSPGDEGQIFAEGLEKRGPIDAKRLEEARKDGDRRTIEIDGKRRQVELDNRRPGPVPGGPNDPGSPLPFNGNGNGFGPTPFGPGGGPPTLRSGGFPPGVAQLSPTPEEVKGAQQFLEREHMRLQQDLNHPDPAKRCDAYRELRDLQAGADRLKDLAQGRANELMGEIDRMRAMAEGNALQHFPSFIKALDATGQKGTGLESVDELAERAAFGKHAPIDARSGPPDFGNKLWSRLQDASRDDADLRAKVGAAERSADLKASRAKRAYEAALFENDPSKRAEHIRRLEENGAKYWKTQLDDLKAGEVGYAYRDGKRDPAAFQELTRGWRRLADGGNDFASQSLNRFSTDAILKDLGSTDERTRTGAQAKVDHLVREYQDRRWTERTDHILHGLDTGAPLNDLTRARERLQKEVDLGSGIARKPLDRVTVQENLTGLLHDPSKASAKLRELSDGGNQLARDSLRQAFLSADRPDREPASTYAPIPIDREGTAVKTPKLDPRALDAVKVEAAKALGTKTTREDARALADVYTRFWGSPDVQHESKKSLEKGLAEKNRETLAGLTDVVVEKTAEGHPRLGRLFAEGRHLQGFDAQLARVARAADAGSERSIDALVATVPHGGKSYEEKRHAFEAERALVKVAKTGRADRVTSALLDVPKEERGDGASYHRALGNAAAERTDTARKWRQTDDVLETLRDGVRQNYDNHRETAHDGAADGLAAMAKHWTGRDSVAMANNLSPPVVAAIERASDSLPKEAADSLRYHLRSNLRYRADKEDGHLSAEALGRLGKHATGEDVWAIHDAYKKAADNTRAFGSLVNILSRTESADVRKDTLDALWSKDAVWKTGKISADTRKRLIDYVSGTGDPVLSNDINKLVYDLGIRPPVAGLWSSWGVGGTPAEIQKKAMSARSFYGDDATRKLGARVDLWNRLSPESRVDLLGYDAKNLTEAQRRQILGEVPLGWAADRMAAGSLQDSPASFLLTDVEGRVKRLAADRSEAYRSKEREAAALARERSQHLASLTGTTKEGVGFLDDVGHVFSYVNPRNLFEKREKTAVDRFEDRQNEDLAKLRDYDAKTEAKGREVAEAARHKLFLDSSLASYHHRRELSEGRVKQADLIALDQWKEHGDALKQLNPSMYGALHDRGKGAKAEGAWQRLQRHDLVKLDAAPAYSGSADERFGQAAKVLRGKPEGAERAAVVRQALGVMDQDPAIVEMTKAAGLLSKDLPTIQRMLQAGMDGRKYDGYVNDVRARAAPLRNEIDRLRNDPATMGKIDERIRQLQDLEKGLTSADEKKQVADRIKSLEGMRELVKSDGVKHVLDTVMSDKFDSDTWASWLKKDGPKMLGAIAVGVAAAGFTVATFGAGAPLAAIAAAGAFGGILGYEATAEGLHFIRHNFDDDVKSGRMLYTDRSRIGAKLDNEPIFDPETGKFRERSWGGDVAIPYAQDFLTSFATTYLTMGAGQVLAKGLNGLGASVAQKLMGHPAATRMAGNMAQIESVLGKEAAKKTLGTIMSHTAQRFPAELADEVKDEVAGKFLEKGLQAVDPRLGMLSNVLLATGKGLRLDVPSADRFRFDGKHSADVRQALESVGYKTHVDPTKPGTIRVDTPDGPVYWQAHDGTAPSDADWKKLAEAKAYDPQKTLPKEFTNDPKILKERAEATNQIADRLEKGLKAGDLPQGKTKADVEAEIQRYRAEAKVLEQNAVRAGTGDPLVDLFDAAEKLRYEQNLPTEHPIAHVKAKLAEMPLPNPSGGMRTYADLPSVKRTLARLEALEKSGAIENIVWAPYTPGHNSSWSPGSQRMQIYAGSPLDVITAMSHELTHVPQNSARYRDGMTKEQFLAENSARLINGEVQTYRTDTDMWREMMKHGLPKDQVPKQAQKIMEILDNPELSTRKKREMLKEFIAKDLGYQAKYDEVLGKAWDDTVAQGHPERMQLLVDRSAPPPGTRRPPGDNGGRGPAKPLANDDPRVVAAKQKYGLNDVETMRFAQMTADLDRVADLAKKDPAAALRELHEMSKSKEWAGATIQQGPAAQISDATVRDMWKEMQAYDRPEGMSMEHLAYLYGRDEGGFRTRNGYAGGANEIAFPKGIGIPPKPANMPQPVYDAMVRGLQHEHALGVLRAYQQAAGDRVKAGMPPLGVDIPELTLDSLDKRIEGKARRTQGHQTTTGQGTKDDHQLATGKREAAFQRMMQWIEQGNAQQAVTNNPTGSTDTERAKARRQEEALANTVRRREAALDRAIRDGDLQQQRLLEEEIKRLNGQPNHIDQLRADYKRVQELEAMIVEDAGALTVDDWRDLANLPKRIDQTIRELGLESAADLPK
jgi:hypothetical protein